MKTCMVKRFECDWKQGRIVIEIEGLSSQVKDLFERIRKVFIEWVKE